MMSLPLRDYPLETEPDSVAPSSIWGDVQPRSIFIVTGAQKFKRRFASVDTTYVLNVQIAPAAQTPPAVSALERMRARARRAVPPQGQLATTPLEPLDDRALPPLTSGMTLQGVEKLQTGDEE